MREMVKKNNTDSTHKTMSEKQFTHKDHFLYLQGLLSE